MIIIYRQQNYHVSEVSNASSNESLYREFFCFFLPVNSENNVFLAMQLYMGPTTHWLSVEAMV